MTPDFITFTGADDWTDVGEMQRLSAHYPIEWGILFSTSRQGVDPRYPSEGALSRLVRSGLRLAAHLCGDYSKAIMTGRPISPPVDLSAFTRIQINHVSPDPEVIGEFQKIWGPRCIAQTRGPEFPPSAEIDWLFDASGGRGLAPASWLPYPGRFVGYAGGIGPDNIAAVIAAIDAPGTFWIDMESKVRTNDRFDLDLCRRVCEAVYSGLYKR